MIAKILIVGFGGFAGSVLRFLMCGLADKLTASFAMPCGTLLVNLTGSFLIGILGRLADTKGLISHELRLLLIVGLLGGFTTFSSFSYEVFHLIKESNYILAVTNVTLQVVISLMAVAAGYWLCRAVV